MDSVELTDWLAKEEIDPSGEFRADLRQAHTSAAIWNKGRSGNVDPATLDDFMWKWEPDAEPEREQTPEEIEAAVDRAFTLQHVKEAVEEFRKRHRRS